MARLSKRAQKVLLISLIGLLGVLLYLLTLIVTEEFNKLGSDLKDFVTLVILSGIGLTLFAIRDKPKVDKNFVDSLEVLILIIFPTIAAFSLVKEPDIKLIIAIFPYLGTVTGWYVFFVRRLYKEQETKQTHILNKDLIEKLAEEQTKKTETLITFFWGILMAYGITAVWLILQLIPLF